MIQASPAPPRHPAVAWGGVQAAASTAYWHLHFAAAASRRQLPPAAQHLAPLHASVHSLLCKQTGFSIKKPCETCRLGAFASERIEEGDTM